MVDGWTSRGVSSTCWIVLDSLPVAKHESRGGYYTGYDPRPIGPWALAQTFSRTKTEPKPHSKSISFWMHDRRAHVWSIMTCSRMCLLRTAHVPGNSVLSWGVSLPSNLLEVGTNSNANTTISNRAYSLPGIIKIGPHKHEWNQNVIKKPPPTSRYK